MTLSSVLPAAPPEPERNSSISLLAPGFSVALHLLILDARSKGLDVGVFEGLRSTERQEWLYGQGRTFRGPRVTNAATIWKSWHGYGNAADLAFRHASGDFYWPTDESLWEELYQLAPLYGLTTGLHWSNSDGPHVQPAKLKVTPSELSKAAFERGGLPEVWRVCGTLTVEPRILAMVRNGRLG